MTFQQRYLHGYQVNNLNNIGNIISFSIIKDHNGYKYYYVYTYKGMILRQNTLYEFCMIYIIKHIEHYQHK